MLSKVFTAGLSGIDGFVVTVECNISDGLNRFEIVGLPDTAVKESKERVRAAIQNNGYTYPDGVTVINMAPADRRKEGTSYDFAVFIGILISTYMLSGDIPLDKRCFIGELSLSGDINPVRGVLSMCLAAKEAGINEVFVPQKNAAEAAVSGLTVFGVKNAGELVEHLNGVKLIEPTVFDRAAAELSAYEGLLDYSDVKGQEKAKRAAEIAAAGGHNLLLIGPPGTGKSMIAKRLPSIMPPMSFDEALETTKIYSAAGMLPPNTPLIVRRPFRAPHHTASTSSIAGGGKQPMPGEISLSHNGVLFLDELPEFDKPVMEVLRQPLEDGNVTISRASGRMTFPSRLMLCCAMNPCKCGYFGSSVHQCTCKKDEIKKYLSKLSGPLMDRIDIQIEVPQISYDELVNSERSESSEVIRGRVIRAREFAKERLNAAGAYSNSQLTSAQLREYCMLEPNAEAIIRAAYEKLGMSARGHDRILRVSRTIADLCCSETIKAAHIAEAIQLRSLDRKYWN